MDKFSERLVALRKEKDLTQAEFARLCGKQRTTVSGYETEGKEPDFALLCQMAENLRTASVCIQLDAQSQAADLEDKLFQSFWLKTGLASADADSIKNPAPLFQKGQNIIRRIQGKHIFSKNFTVMAERTAEIAAAGKDRCRYISGIVQKCGFLQSADDQGIC